MKDKIVNGWGDSGRGGSIDELRAFWEVCDELSVMGNSFAEERKLSHLVLFVGKLFKLIMRDIQALCAPKAT